MQEKYERQMKKGVLDMLVLQLLTAEKKYGYQLIMELREKAGDIFGLKEGTLYPILYRLEEEELEESRWFEAENKQIRDSRLWLKCIKAGGRSRKAWSG